MTVIQAVVLGALQGVTEFLPISSSGHLIAVPALLGWEEQSLTFDLIIHLATLTAVVVAMRADVLWLWSGVMKRDPARLRVSLMIVVATLPALVVGFFLGDWLQGFRQVPIVAVSLIVWGVLLGLADRFSTFVRGQSDIGRLRWWQAMVIGIIQVFSFIPGTSRSGATMTAGLLAGLDRVAAARISFLLAIPVTLAAGAAALIDVAEHGTELALMPLLVGFGTAFVTGILAIRLLLVVVKRSSFMWFAVYRIAFGLFLLLAL
jgi:undecaprenyl-diphosphatase